MSRHFLVKRHRQCAGNSLYRDCLLEKHEGVANGTYTATLIDTDKQMLIRDYDYISDYSGYSSPDSGYAASPKGIHLGFAREKENLTDRENNNSKYITKSIIHYENVHDNVINTIVTTSSSGSSSFTNNEDPNSEILEPSDAPLDLSLSGGKKNAQSSASAYLQQENHNQHAHNYQQQQIHHLLPSPNNSATVLGVYFKCCGKFFQDENISTHLCPKMSLLSSSSTTFSKPILRNFPSPVALVSSLCPDKIKTHPVAALKPETHSPVPVIALSKEKQRSSSSIASLPTSPTAASTLETVTGRKIPLRTPSPLHSPRRKRVIPDDSGETMKDLFSQGMSKTVPALRTNASMSASITTPTSKETSAHKSGTEAPVIKKLQVSVPNGKKLKAMRRLNFDVDTTSPVSGTIIKGVADFQAEEGKVVYGDIEPSFNFVDVTPEARAELEKIDNIIGDYICQLCEEFYEDAFQLAQHRCSRIVHVEYRCPECEKVFNCPANLASHRRWHKPRVNELTTITAKGLTRNNSIVQSVSSELESCRENLNETATIRQTDNSSTIFPAKDVEIQNIYFYTGDLMESEPAPSGMIASGIRASGIKASGINTSGVVITSNRESIGEYDSSISNFADVIQNNSPTQENDLSVVVVVTKSQTSSSDKVLDTTATSSAVNQYTPTPDQHSRLRLNTVIAAKPLHTTRVSNGSNLTPEERSLVIQVLNCHSHQQQATSSTAATLQPVSDSHCNNVSTVTENSSRSSSSCLDEDIINGNQVRISRAIFMSSKPQNIINSSSPPLSPQNLRETYDIDDDQRQKQKLHNQTVLSEQQGNEENECSLCGKKFQRQAYLRKHIVSQHRRQYGAHELENIDSKGKKAEHISTISYNSDSSDQRNINTTIRYHEPGKAVVMSESESLPHVAVNHELIPHLGCSTCGLTFTSKTSLDKHVRSAHAAEIFSCKYCPSRFHSSPGLTRHINKCHPTENKQVILLQLPAARTC